MGLSQDDLLVPNVEMGLDQDRPCISLKRINFLGYDSIKCYILASKKIEIKKVIACDMES